MATGAADPASNAPMLGVAPNMHREPNMSEVLPFVQEAHKQDAKKD